jgi:uncharacterized pyridoxamine 5'-phosphate oxidase family protein
MGFVMSYKGRLYMGTSNTKDMYRQMRLNPKIEISAFGADGKWMRVAGKVVFDDSTETQTKALDAAPQLKPMYSVGDGKFTLFYFEPGTTATIHGFDSSRKEIKL